MPFKDYDTLTLAIIFLAPGFIIRSMECMLAARPPSNIVNDWMQFLILSLLNNAIWYEIIYLLQHSEYLHNSPFLSACLWFFVLCVGPLLIGTLLALNHNKAWSRKFFKKLGFDTVHIIPYAWDWKFSKSQRVAHWVIITLNDGTVTAGIFGENSFASSDAKERDIYIEQLYTIDAHGKWTQATTGKGILVLGRDIRYIEFQPV